MHETVGRLVALAVPILLSSANVHAQIATRTGGAWTMAYVDNAGVPAGSVEMTFGSNALTWEGLSNGARNSVSAAVQIPGSTFDRVGSLLGFGNGRVLVTGQDSTSGHGWLIRAQVSFGASPQIQQLDAVDLGAGIDPAQAYWHSGENRIYVLDQVAARIHVAPMSGWVIPPSQFTVIADGTTLPILADRDPIVMLRRSLRPDGGGVSLQWLTLQDMLIEGRGPWWVWEQGSTWMAEEHRPVVSQPVPHWELQESRHAPTFGPIHERGAAGAFQIVDMQSQTVVFSASTTAADQWESFTLPTDALVPGSNYVLVGAGATPTYGPSVVFAPRIRYGAPTEVGSFTAGHAQFPIEWLAAGNADFAVSSTVHWNQPLPQSTETLLFYTWVGLDGPAATSNIGGVIVIANPVLAFGPDSRSLMADLKSCPLVRPIAIPAEPDLVGARLLFQNLIVTAAGAVVVSDVIGGIVGDAGGNGAQGARNGRPRTGETSTAGRALRASAILRGQFPAAASMTDAPETRAIRDRLRHR